MPKFIFVNYEYPPLGGGAGRAMQNIVSRLAARGHQVEVITSSYKELPDREDLNNLVIRRIPAIRKHREKSSVFEMIVFICTSVIYSLGQANRNVDGVVAFFTIPSGPAAWIISKLNRCSLIISLRGGDVPGFMGDELSFYHRLTKPVIRFLWKSAKYVVANSLGLARLAKQTDAAIDFEIIPNGIDLSIFGIKEVSAKTDDVFTVLYVGRLNKQKNLPCLIDAFGLFLSKYKGKAKLRLVGDGPEREYLEELVIKTGLGEYAEFTGWVDHADLKSYYESAHLFALSSVNEGMPNVVLEAMAHGLPIVSTQVEGIDELVKSDANGFVVTQENSQAMADAFLELSNNPPKRNKMAVCSLEFIKSFDWGQVTESYERLLK